MGMLFLMLEERMQLWMKNTYVGLDIVYSLAAGQVVSIQATAQLLTRRRFPQKGRPSSS